MQKRVIRAGIVLLAFAVLTSCQPRYQYYPLLPGVRPSDPGTGKTYTVTVDYGYEGSEDRILADQSVLAEPVSPDRGEDFEFAYWAINGKKVEDSQWGTALTGNVTLEAVWIAVYDSIQEIPELAEALDAKTSDGFSFSFVNEAEFDGQGLVKIRNWQDLYTPADLTLKGINFSRGLSIHATNPSGTDITIMIEDCEINACLQEEFKEMQKRPGRIDNSGDGLCLAIDSSASSDPSASENQNRGEVDVVVRNNHLTGDNNPSAERNGYVTLDDLDQGRRWKSRGNGVSLGNQSGGTVHLRSAEIDGNTFTGLRGHAVQLYQIASGTNVTISGNNFVSWGINKNNLAKDDGIVDYAIRGDLKAGDPGEVTLEDNTYAETVNGGFDVSERHVAIDNWNGIVS